MKPWKKSNDQQINFYGGSRRNLRNNAQKCLDVVGKSDSNNRHTTFNNCHNGLNQAWYIDRRGVRYHKYPQRDGVTFQIRTRMRSKRVLYVAEHIGSHQYRLRIQKNKNDKPQTWTFDFRTKTLRQGNDRKRVLSG